LRVRVRVRVRIGLRERLKVRTRARVRVRGAELVDGRLPHLAVVERPLDASEVGVKAPLRRYG